MGTTPTGLPYPEPTDPVAQGADAIKALALALDPRSKRGAVNWANLLTNSGPTAALGDVNGGLLTFTAQTGHLYKITGWALFNSTIDWDGVDFLITGGANDPVAQAQIIVPSAGKGQQSGIVTAVVSPPGGSATYKLRIGRAWGTGTVTLVAGPGHPGLFLIEEI